MVSFKEDIEYQKSIIFQLENCSYIDNLLESKLTFIGKERGQDFLFAQLRNKLNNALIITSE